MRAAVQEKLQASEERFSKAFKTSPVPMAILARASRLFLDVNDRFVGLADTPRQKLIGSVLFSIPLWTTPETRARVEQLLADGQPIRNWECKITGPDGKPCAAILSAESFLLGQEQCVLLVTEDVSERASLEGQLRQAQKMEAVGQLAAGVAHDFNNLLTVVQGYTQLLLAMQTPGSMGREALEKIISATQRAAGLTGQLLTFSRKRVAEPRAVELNKVVTNVTGMLRPLLGENIRLNVRPAATLPSIMADAAMIEQVIVNLAVNARDAMPKGGDLHNHLWGSMPIEDLIRWGREDGACVDPLDFTAYAKADCTDTRLVSMSQATPGSALHKSILAAWSMEGFQGDMLAAHDHFFAVFAKFYAVILKSHYPEGIAAAMTAAAEQGFSYVEFQHDFDADTAAALATSKMDATRTWDAGYLIAKRKELVADTSFTAAIETSRSNINDWMAEVSKLLGCGTALASPACDVTVRWLLSGCRYAAREWVFGQFVFGFELAQVQPAMLGINLVKPEEGDNSLAYYDDEMLAAGVLRAANAADPGRRPVHVSLHAGELVPAVMPVGQEKHLGFHIRHAVEIAGAERIGHGVDALGETTAPGQEELLALMARRNVFVEICLGSNALLLGVTGAAHPLAAYRKRGVPVALATDDMAIFRADAVDDWVRAVNEQHLGYRDLKELSRRSIEHSFLPGASLWQRAFTRTDDAIPLPIQKDWRPMLPYMNELKDLNYYGMNIAGLEEGKYDVLCDGVKVGTYTAKELAAGVNLGNAEAGPLFDQGKKVFDAINKKNGSLVKPRFDKILRANRDRSKLTKEQQADLDKQLAAIEEEQKNVYKLMEMKAHKWEVKAAK